MPTPARVLIADDCDDMRHVLRDYLILAGFDVLLASCSAEAQEYLAQGGIAALLADEHMEKLTGTQLIAWTRRHYPDVVCAMVTADTAATAGALAAGAVAVFDKPLDPRRLAATLYACLPLATAMKYLVGED